MSNKEIDALYNEIAAKNTIEKSADVAQRRMLALITTLLVEVIKRMPEATQ